VEGLGQAAADAGSAAGDEDRVPCEFHWIAPLVEDFASFTSAGPTPAFQAEEPDIAG
jgi:hypothetical protein